MNRCYRLISPAPGIVTPFERCGAREDDEIHDLAFDHRGIHPFDPAPPAAGDEYETARVGWWDR